MSTGELKYNIFRLIDTINDESKLQSIFDRLRKEQGTDWWDDLSSNQRASIEEGIQDAKAGNTLTDKEVQARMQKKFPQLKF